jgi:hypothetical protein
MSAQLTQTMADRIAARMRRDGYEGASSDDVRRVWMDGYLPEDHPYAESLASAILQECDELGLVP